MNAGTNQARRLDTFSQMNVIAQVFWGVVQLKLQAGVIALKRFGPCLKQARIDSTSWHHANQLTHIDASFGTHCKGFRSSSGNRLPKKVIQKLDEYEKQLEEIKSAKKQVSNKKNSY